MPLTTIMWLSENHIVVFGERDIPFMNLALTMLDPTGMILWDYCKKGYGE